MRRLEILCENPEEYSSSLTAILVPDGYDADELRFAYARPSEPPRTRTWNLEIKRTLHPHRSVLVGPQEPRI
jgi:hypothetical protein